MAARIIVNTLKLTQNDTMVGIEEIAKQSQTTLDLVQSALQELTIFQNSPRAYLEPGDRFKLAIFASRLGSIQEAANALTWQEFEAFSEDCFLAAGFQTRKGFVVRDSVKRWQIDLSARKGSMVLGVDCKHWRPPNYASKYRKAAEHQKTAMNALVHHLRVNEHLNDSEIFALPMLLTLSELTTHLLDGVALVPIGLLPDFLDRVNPYDPGLPFISFVKAESS